MSYLDYTPEEVAEKLTRIEGIVLMRLYVDGGSNTEDGVWFEEEFETVMNDLFSETTRDEEGNLVATLDDWVAAVNYSQNGAN